MKNKTLITTTAILVIFFTGFVSGRMIKPFIHKDLPKTEILFDKTDIENKYKKTTQAYIDSANGEMFNFSVRYYHLNPGLLPDHYTCADGDTVEFNKENFFYYYSMYKITNYLSSAKSSMIEGLTVGSEDTSKVSF